jgi:hypothetical protein
MTAALRRVPRAYFAVGAVAVALVTGALVALLVLAPGHTAAGDDAEAAAKCNAACGRALGAFFRAVIRVLAQHLGLGWTLAILGGAAAVAGVLYLVSGDGE